MSHKADLVLSFGYPVSALLVSLVKKEFFTQMGLALLIKKCNDSSSALTQIW